MANREPMDFFVALFNGHINNAFERARAAMNDMGEQGREWLREVDMLEKEGRGIMKVGQVWPTPATRCYMSFVAQFVNENCCERNSARSAEWSPEHPC